MFRCVKHAVEVAVEEAGLALAAEEDQGVGQGFEEWGDWRLGGVRIEA